VGGGWGYTTGRRTVRPGFGTPAYGAAEAQQIYLVALISLAAKVAKADGRVSEAEVRSFDQFLQHQLGMSASERRIAARIFNQARDSATPAEDYARQIRGVLGHDPDRLRDLVALLLKVAMADGRLAAEEERLIRSITLALGLTGRDFEAALAMFRTGSLDAAYRALGLDASVDDESVKRAYRRLAKEYHPDTQAAKGVSEELRSFAREKMVAINEAYRRVREARGF
jgi:DnaJ like chaperone protein